MCRPVSLSLLSSKEIKKKEKKKEIEGDKQKTKKQKKGQHSSLNQMQLLKMSSFPSFGKGGKKNEIVKSSGLTNAR